jgi:hypothetical protein
MSSCSAILPLLVAGYPSSIGMSITFPMSRRLIDATHKGSGLQDPGRSNQTPSREKTLSRGVPLYMHDFASCLSSTVSFLIAHQMFVPYGLPVSSQVPINQVREGFKFAVSSGVLTQHEASDSLRPSRQPQPPVLTLQK